MARPKVLVVDDDLDIRLMLKCIIEDRDYDVCEASNGREALERVGDEAPNLILLDLAMPVMDGGEFLERLGQNQNGATVRTPVLLMSADAGVHRKAASLGANGYLRKPFDLAALLHAVERLAVAQP